MTTLILLFYSWLVTPGPGVTMENFRRLRAGMSKQRVISILGPPYREGPQMPDLKAGAEWRGNEGKITCYFDEEGLLRVGAMWDKYDSDHPEHSLQNRADFVESFRGWLGW